MSQFVTPAHHYQMPFDQMSPLWQLLQQIQVQQQAGALLNQSLLPLAASGQWPNPSAGSFAPPLAPATPPVAPGLNASLDTNSALLMHIAAAQQLLQQQQQQQQLLMHLLSQTAANQVPPAVTMPLLPGTPPLTLTPPAPPVASALPPSSMPLKAVKAGVGSGPKPITHIDANRAVAERRQVIVKFVTDALSDAELRQICEQFGPVELARIVVDKSTGRTRGYAFAVFSSPADALTAVSGLTGMVVHGRHLAAAITETERKRAF